MATTTEQNFAARLVARMTPASCLIDAASGKAIAGKDLPPLIAAYGSSLRSARLEAGDRVLIACSLSPVSALVYLGAIYAGLIAVPIEEHAVRGSLRTLVEATGAKAVWSEAGLRGDLGSNGSVLGLQGELAALDSETMSPADCAPSDVAALMGTSGSTGRPRFVIVSHQNLIANTEAIVRAQGLTSEDRAMLILPLSYCFGASVLHTHLFQGGSVVFDRRFMFPDRVLRAMHELKCTTFAGVPTAYNSLLRRSNIRDVRLPGLRRFLQAGGGLAPERIREMREAFPAAKFYVMYGQTEATARISCMEPERWEEKPGSVGRALDNLQVSITDDAGKTLPAGQVGELVVKGPSVCAGYWNEPEESRRVFGNGWLRTGDLARQDEQGYLWIAGRKGTFLKIRGRRVSFAEVEEKVAAIPGVYECAASRADHPEVGEALVLFVVSEDGARISEEQIRRQLPVHWALDSVHFVPELPKTAAGKVSRSSLAVLAKEHS